MEQRFAVVGAPSSARKVLRLAWVPDDLPGQFPLVGAGQGWSSPKFRSESSTARSGLRRPSRPIPIHGQRPAADVHVGRVVSGLRFAVNFLTSLHKSLSPTANRCFPGLISKLKESRCRILKRKNLCIVILRWIL